MPPSDRRLWLAQCVQLACIFEATARKAGNVHRYRDFADLTYVDFLLSAAVISPVLERAVEFGIGATVRRAVEATRGVVPTNSNLGTILLLAPLAAASGSDDLHKGVATVLGQTTVEDSQAVYAAIRQAAPGGLGESSEQDVRDAPTLPLREVMALAAGRDLIARQYANAFADVFDLATPTLLNAFAATGELETGIIAAHLSLMAELGDTHIARRAGAAEAAEAHRRARTVVDADWPATIEARRALIEFDHWLREPGTRRNPGSTADLTAAALFVALCTRRISLPAHFPSSVEPLP